MVTWDHMVAITVVMGNHKGYCYKNHINILVSNQISTRGLLSTSETKPTFIGSTCSTDSKRMEAGQIVNFINKFSFIESFSNILFKVPHLHNYH
ncbi:hypothetical protein BLOT_007773 [Blomia tropicalis]|nr:hypothetical protein BLOT_007773 [Blomia tropicalis]